MTRAPAAHSLHDLSTAVRDSAGGVDPGSEERTVHQRNDCPGTNYTEYPKREHDRRNKRWIKRGWKKCNECGRTFDEWGPEYEPA